MSDPRLPGKRKADDLSPAAPRPRFGTQHSVSSQCSVPKRLGERKLEQLRKRRSVGATSENAIHLSNNEPYSTGSHEVFDGIRADVASAVGISTVSALATTATISSTSSATQGKINYGEPSRELSSRYLEDVVHDKGVDRTSLSVPGSQTSVAIVIDDDMFEDIVPPSSNQLTTSESTSTPHMEAEGVFRSVKVEEDSRQKLPIKSEPDFVAVQSSESVVDSNGGSAMDSWSFFPCQETIDSPVEPPHEPNSLPVLRYREEILRVIDNCRVVIITGPTGCGKSTQVPQYIVKHGASRNRNFRVLVAQPRRVAATSLAHRVAQEMHVRIGTEVGYIIGGRHKVSADTKISYVSTGSLQELLVRDRTLSSYTHVIVDEVHERTLETDTVLCCLLSVLEENVSIRIILSSATIDVQRFQQYFQSVRMSNRFKSRLTASHVNINFPSSLVDNFFLDDLIKPDFHSSYRYPLDVETVALLKTSVEDMNTAVRNGSAAVLASQWYRNVTTALVHFLLWLHKNKSLRDAIVVFLPGRWAISDLFAKLQLHPESQSMLLLPLHSTVALKDQATALATAPPGFRKVILATNLAESAITIPDLRIVVDLGLTKMLYWNAEAKCESFNEEFISVDRATQRAGRAGRVRRGECYRFFTVDMFETFKTATVPELCRSNLSPVILRFIKLGYQKSPSAMLDRCPDPPSAGRIDSAVQDLLALRAIERDTSVPTSAPLSRISAAAVVYKTTHLGSMLSHIPVDPSLGMLCIYGHIFGCLTDCIILTSILCRRDLFMRKSKEPLRTYTFQRLFSAGFPSDLIASLNAYKWWTSHKRRLSSTRTEVDDEQLARSKFLNVIGLREVEDLVAQITESLYRIHITDPLAVSPPSSTAVDTSMPAGSAMISNEQAHSSNMIQESAENEETAWEDDDMTDRFLYDSSEETMPVTTSRQPLTVDSSLGAPLNSSVSSSLQSSTDDVSKQVVAESVGRLSEERDIDSILSRATAMVEDVPSGTLDHFPPIKIDAFVPLLLPDPISISSVSSSANQNEASQRDANTVSLGTGTSTTVGVDSEFIPELTMNDYLLLEILIAATFLRNLCSIQKASTMPCPPKEPLGFYETPTDFDLAKTVILEGIGFKTAAQLARELNDYEEKQVVEPLSPMNQLHCESVCISDPVSKIIVDKDFALVEFSNEVNHDTMLSDTLPKVLKIQHILKARQSVKTVSVFHEYICGVQPIFNPDPCPNLSGHGQMDTHQRQRPTILASGSILFPLLVSPSIPISCLNLVPAVLQTSQRGSILRASNNTLLPPIPGLRECLFLIFAPNAIVEPEPRLYAHGSSRNQEGVVDDVVLDVTVSMRGSLFTAKRLQFSLSDLQWFDTFRSHIACHFASLSASPRQLHTAYPLLLNKVREHESYQHFPVTAYGKFPTNQEAGTALLTFLKANPCMKQQLGTSR